MSKYSDLTAFLAGLDPAHEWTFNFAKLEKVIGAALPDSARKYQAWWANQSGKGHSQAYAWGATGWRTSNVDLQNERVTFINDRKVSRPPPSKPPSVAATSPGEGGGLSIHEAKIGLARTFGIEPEQIEITIKG